MPVVEPPFEWRPHAWGAALVCRALEPHAAHLFTTRQLDLSQEEAWATLAGDVGVARPALLGLTQTHSARVLVVSKADSSDWVRPEADGLVTNDPEVALSVRAADCAPILLVDRVTGAVGAVHAGWRGTAAGIVGQAVRTMTDAFGTRPEDLLAAIGPNIGACCYDVGSELVDAFAAHGHARHLIDRWFVVQPPRRGERTVPPLRLDVAGANRDQLVLAGVPETQVHTSGLCTANHLDVLTSYRAEREKAGRLAAVIRVTPSAT